MKASVLRHAYQVGFGVIKADAECAAGESALGGGCFAVLAHGCGWRRGAVGAGCVSGEKQQ